MSHWYREVLLPVLPPALRHRLLAREVWLLHELRTNPDTEYSVLGAYRTRCVFIHIPKTAGISLARAVYGNMGLGHMSVTTAEQVFGRQYREFFRFCIVRNPWDRAVSAFLYLKQKSVTSPLGADARRCASFEEFATTALDANSIWADQHFFPQVHWLRNRTGTIEMDFIGRFESLEQDVRELGRRLGREFSLPHTNKSEHLHYASYYSDRTRQIIAGLYKDDIDAFGYEFDIE